MQANVSRFLLPIFKRADAQKEKADKAGVEKIGIGQEMFTSNLETTSAEIDETVEIPPEFNGKDYLSFLLYIDAEIEHGLMIQYLYAAYSLGGPDIDVKYRDKIRSWQEVILGIAKEEMGHLISVENVLKLIGAPLNFKREDYPWDTPFYPFPFTLERFTLKSLAKYVYAEAPKDWINGDDPIAIEIKNTVNSGGFNPHLVEALFEVILQIINDPNVIEDEAFQSETYPYQSKFDEWGRGYRGGERGNTTQANPAGSPDVLIRPVMTRDDAFNALTAIAEQGEATGPNADPAIPSHFERFLAIYKEMKEIIAEAGAHWQPSRNVALNPYIFSGDQNDVTNKEADGIKDPEAQLWAHLFNLRYRLLLNFLTHSFQLEDDVNTSGAKTPRATIINATFGEMYNLRSIAFVLVKTPLEQGSDKMAGPPFLIPYTLDLPNAEHNKWRHHKNVLTASGEIINKLLAITKENNHKYLYGLKEADLQLIKIIDRLTTTRIF